ncbi:hypothetical protein E2C01_004663 [Portunus trituberculatus]|uniref:Uncharacterized protein n=1 Tax=Portunus trituberculatus TaxID=210409 RepID=A0A5B7CUJ6_PORTR|nr:hypothetical protein [Portunus trituberculatus]
MDSDSPRNTKLPTSRNGKAKQQRAVGEGPQPLKHYGRAASPVPYVMFLTTLGQARTVSAVQLIHCTKWPCTSGLRTLTTTAMARWTRPASIKRTILDTALR